MLRRALKDLRSLPAINRSATTLARWVCRGRPPSWLVAHLPRKGLVEIDLPGGRQVRFWSEADDWITSRLWWLGIDGYEPETARPFMRFAESSRTILDIGAYTGYYALLAASVSPNSRIFAFEPHPRIAARLGRNVDVNDLTSVAVLPFAVGAQRGGASFHIGGPALPSSSSLAPEWEGRFKTCPTAVVDIDSFARDWNLESVDLVKIDVETAEAEVIRGMQDVIRRFRPVIFMEIIPGQSTEEISDQLSEADYRFFHLTFSGPVPEHEGLRAGENFVDHMSTPLNHLLCPAERVPDWLES